MVERVRGVRPDKTGRKTQIRWRHRGRDYTETLDINPTPAGLEKAAKLRKELIARQKYGPVVGAVDAPFAQTAQTYLNNAPIALSTRNGYRDSLNIYWLPAIGHLEMREIRFTTLKRLDETIKWKSPKTRQNAITALRRVFKYAMDLELCDANPAMRLEAIRYQKAGPDPYSLAERTALLAALEGTHAALYFRVAFDTGMRTGELLALRWGDFDAELSKLKVTRSKVRRIEKDSTKTNKARHVILGEPETIQRLKDASTPFNGPIFLNQYGRQYQSAFHLNKAFRKAHKRAGIRMRKGPYPWRHTYASLGIIAGLPPAFLAKQLGHSLDVFYRRYATWISGDDDRALAQKLATAWRQPA